MTRKTMCDTNVQRRPYGELGSVDKGTACGCCTSVTSGLGPISPGWGCEEALVDELVEEYIEEFPDGKLYLRAEIEELPPLRGIVHSDRWNKLVRRWSEHIVAIDSLVRASGMSLEDVLPIMEGEFLPYTESGLWSACQSILDGYDDRQRALSSEEATQVIDVLESALEDKQAQMDAIRFMMESE